MLQLITAYLQRLIVPDITQVVCFTGRQQCSCLLQQHQASTQDGNHLQQQQQNSLCKYGADESFWRCYNMGTPLLSELG